MRYNYHFESVQFQSVNIQVTSLEQYFPMIMIQLMAKSSPVMFWLDLYEKSHYLNLLCIVRLRGAVSV